MKKYHTGYDNASVSEVEVIREKQRCVYVAAKTFKGVEVEHRRAKRSDGSNYFDTWGQAHAYLLEQQTARVNSARRHLELAMGKLSNIKGLKAPQKTAP